MGFTTTRSHGVAATALLAVALSSSYANAALNAMTYKGCYSSSAPLNDQGYYQYQTSGYCQPICVNQNQAVLGLSKGSDCWCGGQLPAASSKVEDSKCNTPCNGFGTEKCGGSGFYSVYLTGTTTDVTEYSEDSDSQSSSTSTTAAAPSVVTSISPGNTVVITVSATPTSSSNSNNNGGGGGTNVAGVAAGVVVGIVGAVALAAGIFFFLRRRKRQQADEDYKRSAQVSDFMAGSKERKAPSSGYSQMSDARLDPEHGRRNSVGSMADEHDYSRRILRVANPDSH